MKEADSHHFRIIILKPKKLRNIAEKYYTRNLDKDEEITGVDLSTDTLSYSGEKPTK